MLIRFLRNEIAIQRSLMGVSLLPRIAIRKHDILIYICWLGGLIVWSRLKRTSKNTERVQED